MQSIDALYLQLNLLTKAIKEGDANAAAHERAFLLGMIFMARKCGVINEEAAEQWENRAWSAGQS